VSNEAAENSAVHARRIMTLERGYDELRTANNRLMQERDRFAARVAALENVRVAADRYVERCTDKNLDSLFDALDACDKITGNGE
jgi:hypothetical protein